MNLNDIEGSIREFTAKTIEEYHFLENEYGYTRKELEKKGFEYPRNAIAFIRYFSEKVAVEVIFGIGRSAITVGLYELKHGKIPEKVSFYGHKGFSRAINLDSLVRMLTDGEITSPLPEIPRNLSLGEVNRRLKKNAELIETKMGEILKTLAERLKEYASNILKGDTSIFPKVQDHHRKFWGVEVKF